MNFPPTLPSPSWASRYAAAVAAKGRSVWVVCRTASTKGGVWLLSVIATVAAPCIPLLIELLRSGTVKSDSIYITAAVMSAAFAVSAEHALFLSLYIALFVINLIFDMVSGPFTTMLDAWAGTLLGLIAALHATERVWWHIVLDRPFPDR
jgi:hypothetical protein